MPQLFHPLRLPLRLSETRSSRLGVHLIGAHPCHRGSLFWRNKKPLAASFETARGFEIIPGDTYFRVCCTIIGSESLTTVFGMGTGVAFRIWSPGKDRRGPIKTRGGKFCCWANGCVLLRSGLFRLIRELFRYLLRRCESLQLVITTRESVEYMWPSVRPLVPVS